MLPSAQPRSRARSASAGSGFAAHQADPTGAHFDDGRGRQRLTPTGPEWRLRPVDADAHALDARWQAQGEPLDVLVPVTFPGLKTRFDELLVDDDADRLFARVKAFLKAKRAGLTAFARAHRIPLELVPKLRALKASCDGVSAERACVRPFLRYRGPLAMGPRGYCYLHRQLILRGDHRLHGEYDPHLEPTKLVFNVHEVPLAAHVLDVPGCVTAYRHSRFAPMRVPERVLAEGATVARRGGALGAPVANLSARGLAHAARLGGPRALFEAIARFVMSEDVQRVWAPAFGTTRVLSVPLDALK